MANKHFIYGVPGVGKSTVATDYATRHGYLYLELDSLRPQAQKQVSREQEPFTYEYTTAAWKQFGKLTAESALSGFLAVRQAFVKYVARELASHGEGYVAEALSSIPNKFWRQTLKSLLW